ncbi:MAG: hypothetical protein U0235_34715 [Polyangiaceae bacterium]
MRAYLPAILSAAIALPLLALAACDETIDATKSPAADAGSDATTTTDGGGEGGTTTSLFQRLGGTAGLTAVVNSLVAEEIKDPEILSYFAPNAAATPPAGKPSVDQIKACLVLQLSAASADPTKGDPTFTYPGTAAGWACRDMKTAHASLHIGNGTFDKFATIAAGVATAAAQASGGKVGPDDLKAIQQFLGLQKPLIVDPAAPDGGFFVFDSGAADTGTTDSSTDSGSADASDSG